MKLKLKNAKDQSSTALSEYKDNQVMLEEARKQLQFAINYYEDKAPTMDSISPSDMEVITDFVQDLHKNVMTINILLGNIKKSQEERRNKGRSKGPLFDGDAADYLTFEQDMDNYLQYDNDTDKMNNYRSGLVGPMKDEMKGLITNCSTYEEMKKAMYNRFGNFEVLLPAETTRLKAQIGRAHV